MFVPEIADDELMTEVIRAHSDRLGLGPVVGRCRLLDAQIRHSHRPSSARCRGWATYGVPVDGAGRPAMLYVRAYPNGGSDQPWADLVAAGRSGGATHLRGHDMIVWTFPDDPALPALPALVDPARLVARLASEHIAALVPQPVTPGNVAVDVVRYQPETSATLRYRVSSGAGRDVVTLYAKAVNTDPTEISRLHDRLWDRSAGLPDLRIAQPLGSDPALRVLWTLGVPGTPLGAPVEPDAIASMARGIAASLAALHGCGVPTPRVVRSEDCLAEGRKKAIRLGEALPRCSSALVGIAEQDGRLGTTGLAPPVVVHGDLHLDQLIAGPDGPVLIDLDSVATGDAELDLAEVVVDVVLRSLPLPAVRAFVGELLEGYERHAPARPIRLALLRALADAEFLTRCHRHRRRRAPGWEAELEQALGQHEVLTTVLPA